MRTSSNELAIKVENLEDRVRRLELRAETICDSCGTKVELDEKPGEAGDIVYCGLCVCGAKAEVRVGGAV